MRIVRAALLLLVSAVSPVALAAPCGGFVDVDDSNPAHAPFCDSVEWMKNRAITFGLTPTLYDPNSFVTRLQMAAFMYRLGFENAFLQDGNAFESAGVGVTAILGTTNPQPLDIRVNNARVMRYEPNAISPNLIGGSPANIVTAGVRGATIGGGGVPVGDTDPTFILEGPNRVTDAYGTVGGGYNGIAGNDTASTQDAAFATVGGGANNHAAATSSTIAGGRSNTANGNASTVAGGFRNTANGNASTVAGGQDNTAAGIASLAAGLNANANADGCFVWGDISTNNQVRCDAPNRFMVRSLGGIYMWAGGTNQATYFGVELQPGDTAWTVSSDRRLKENLQSVETRDVLDRLLALPISTWNLKSQDPSIRHMGAMAQDFRAAFGLGASDVGISTLDADGVALAAIQGLNAKLETERAAKDAEIASLRAELAEIRSLLAGRPSH